MRYLLRLLVCFSITIAFAQKPRVSTIPSWVSEVSYQESIKNEEAESGYYYLLYDQQYDILKETKYAQSVVKILTSEGITQMSNLTFEFDPTYEKLIFHKIDVIRDGERISKLDLRRIETIQRESNLERNLYDGRLTSIVNLNDIREGDIIDYAYSIIGQNPIYQGGYSNILYFQFPAAIGKLHTKVRVPDNDTFEFKYFNKAPKPTEREENGSKEYEWILNDIKPRFYDTNTPVWFDDYQYVQLGNYASWEAVVDQYKSYYTLSASDKIRLKKISDQNSLIDDNETPLSKQNIASSLIDFVQDDVRYFGFENGMNSHRPESPLKVLEQRFGDCKGKSFLLSELLQANGIEAYPMLVHSANGKALDEKLPTPNLFDHCVVTYKMDGKDYYIDPTISNQGTIAQKKFFPNYERGLVLKNGEKNLKKIPFNKQNGISVSEYYDLLEINGGGELSVTTTYKGVDADRVRADFEKRSNASIQKDYLQFYSALYPNIKQDSPIEIEDFRNGKNEFIVREAYTIDSMWLKSTDNEKLIYWEAYPLVLENYVYPSKSPERTAPYYINYPVDVKVDISVNLPEEWEFEDYESTVDSDYFFYDQKVSYYGTKLLINHNYKSKKEFVEPEDVRKYIADHKKVSDDLSYFVTYDQEAASDMENSGLSWFAVLVALLTVILSIYGAYRIYNEYDVPAQDKDPEGRSIGGWLILIAIGVVLTPVIILYSLLADPSIYDAYSWATLWETEGLVGKPFVLFMVVELIINYARVVYGVLLIILFFQRRTIVPRLMIILYAGTFLFLVLDSVVALGLAPDLYTDQENQESYKDIFRAFISCAIWIPYFLISTRVKETFVKRGPNYRQPDPVLETENEETLASLEFKAENGSYNSLEKRLDKENPEN